MKLSTKSQCAARCLVNLAIYGKDHPLSTTEIGAREKISERYLELIFATSKKVGLIASARGSQGDYQLIRPIESIMTCDIITLMETNISIVNTQDERDPTKRILMREVWSLIDDNPKVHLSSLATVELPLS